MNFITYLHGMVSKHAVLNARRENADAVFDRC